MYLKLQRNLFKLIIFYGLLFSGGLCFAQGNENQKINDTERPAAKSAVINKQDSNEAEEHNTHDLEELLKRYNTDAEKVINDTEKLHKIDAETEVKDSEIEKMKLSDDTSKPVSLSSIFKTHDDQDKKKREALSRKNDYSEAVRKALGPLQQISEKELLKKMDEETLHSSMRPYIDRFPNIIVFAVKLVKDKEALPNIAQIAEDKDRLIQFGSIMLATIIFGFFLKKLFRREGRSFIQATFYFFVRSSIMFAIRVYIIYYFFSTELAPASRVFKQVFM